MLTKKRNTKRKRLKSGRKTVTRILMSLLLVFFMASAMAVYFKQETQMDRIQSRHNELSIQHNKVVARKIEFEQLLEKSDSLEYIEQIAREQLGMVKHGEFLFVD
jgi:cell division protein FtsB